jgi:hypothetical protein
MSETKIKFYRATSRPTNLTEQDRGSIYFIPNEGIYIWDGNAYDSYIGGNAELTPFCIPISWAELKTRRDSSTLIQG